MRAKILALSLIFLLAISSVTAFIDMNREPTLAKNDIITYKFLDEEYTIKPLHMVQAGDKEALIEINENRLTIKGNIPETYNDMTIKIKELTKYEITLDLYWTKEDTKRDEKVTVSKNTNENVIVKGNLYKFSVPSIDPVREKLTLDINGEKHTIQEGDRVILADGAVLKVKAVLAGAKSATLDLWASDSDMYKHVEVEEEVVVAKSTIVNRIIGQSQRDLVEAEGKEIITRVLTIASNSADITINGEEYTVSPDDEFEVGDVKVKIKSINKLSTPSVILLSYEIPKQKTVREEIEEKIKDLEESMEQEMDEVEDMEKDLEDLEEVQDDMKEMDELAKEEIPVVENLETTSEKEYKDYTFVESVNWIINSFLGLFR